ncbi:hypothetical protein CK203_092896 [Vitis vinifera]|uniref:Uncharacterized protein n=1 Tax=Vitis vinifera TaxID=29760 RepID=A0A438EJF6_VITVI|nr:hypothetical protein CK203_092896 [Vitis vinifera]
MLPYEDMDDPLHKDDLAVDLGLPVGFYSLSPLKKLILWNPSTRQCNHIHALVFFGYQNCMYNFFYDLDSDDYKIHSSMEKRNVVQWLLFSLREEKLQEMELPSQCVVFGLRVLTRTSLRGGLHLMNECGDGVEMLSRVYGDIYHYGFGCPYRTLKLQMVALCSQTSHCSLGGCLYFSCSRPKFLYLLKATKGNTNNLAIRDCREFFGIHGKDVWTGRPTHHRRAEEHGLWQAGSAPHVLLGNPDGVDPDSLARSVSSGGIGPYTLHTPDSPPCDAQHSSFHPGRILSGRHSTFSGYLSSGWRGGRFNFSGQTCPDPLIGYFTSGYLTVEWERRTFQLPQSDMSGSSDNAYSKSFSLSIQCRSVLLKLPDISD